MHICHLTINTINYERRIQNQAKSAFEKGYSVSVVAYGESDELKSEQRTGFLLQRIHTHIFNKGPLKFIIFNWKLFWYLLHHDPEIIHCHDLWVLPVAIILSQIKKCKIIYDAHEYYEGLEVFVRNKIRKNIWMWVEYLFIDRIDILVTVSEPIANLYKQRYPKLNNIMVIRNLPRFESHQNEFEPMALPSTEDKIILYQGHFRPGRGLENLVSSIPLLSGVHLVLIGGGEDEKKLRQMVEKRQLQDKVTFLGYIPTDRLIRTTARADLGIVLFEPGSLNYASALPNKFFEYIMAGIPVLASQIKTFQDYIDKYQFGITVDPNDVDAIASAIQMMLRDDEGMKRWRKNAKSASKELNWESEAEKMNKIYEEI